ncbi:MAG: hypothetical protein MJ193_03900, partial [Clostridia bacterium]|nr:hypothetical protein [Clostridia bacterium]
MLITIMLTLTAVHYLENDYVFPIALVSLITFVLIDRRVSMLSTATTAIVVLFCYLFTNGFDTNWMYGKIASIVCNAIGAIVIIFFIDKHFTRLKFLLASLASALCSIPFVVSATLAAGDLSINILYNSLFAYGSAVAAIFIFMPLVAIFEGMFNIPKPTEFGTVCFFHEGKKAVAVIESAVCFNEEADARTFGKLA